MPSRRDVLLGFGLTAAVAAVPSSGAASPLLLAEGSSPWSLLAPLSKGAPVGRGWRIVDAAPVVRGASVLTLRHDDGRVASVHLCRRDGAPRGPASTDRCELLVMDGGQGDRPTDESLGRALQSLARRVARNEAAASTEGLLTHPERLARFGPEGL